MPAAASIRLHRAAAPASPVYNRADIDGFNLRRARRAAKDDLPAPSPAIRATGVMRVRKMLTLRSVRGLCQAPELQRIGRGNADPSRNAPHPLVIGISHRQRVPWDMPGIA